MDFAFELNEKVALVLSGERGVVIGRAEYTHRPHWYQLRYVAADGRQVEDWFEGNALRADTTE